MNHFFRQIGSSMQTAPVRKARCRQAGFGLVELMVGLVIGLLATLVIMQMFTVFEGQKRTTSGTADAQTSGSIGLYSLQRDVQLAGFGLPLYDAGNMPLNCTVIPNVDHDNNAATPVISMSAIDIVDGGGAAGASDTVIVRYGTSATAGIPVPVVSTAGPVATVDNNMACFDQDVVYAISENICDVTRVDDSSLDPVLTPVRVNFTNITVSNMPASVAIGTSLSCLTAWNEIRYQVVNNQLTRLDTFNNVVPTPIVAGIVNIQAQYGISASPVVNTISQWVNATGVWAAPGNTSATCDAANANRNCIKAVRVAIVARNDLLEKGVVTAAAPITWDAASANPPVASPSPTIDLTNTANWNQYRYRVYETIIPLRNVVWTRARL